MAFAAFRALELLRHVHGAEIVELLKGAGATFLRVNAALLIASAWTIPTGVAIGFHPRLARIAQPLAQIAASYPATAIFPILLIALVRWGGGLGIGSIALMLLGTQWYILFNVIAGRIGDSLQFEGGGAAVPLLPLAAVESADSAGNFSLPGDRAGDRLWRRLERQHRRRVLSPEGSDPVRRWGWAPRSARPATMVSFPFCCWLRSSCRSWW